MDAPYQTFRLEPVSQQAPAAAVPNHQMPEIIAYDVYLKNASPTAKPITVLASTFDADSHWVSFRVNVPATDGRMASFKTVITARFAAPLVASVRAQ